MVRANWRSRFPLQGVLGGQVVQYNEPILLIAINDGLLNDEQLKTFLCSLPEIQRKSAYCIMMYSFGRLVFPADTHVGRVLSRIGIYRAALSTSALWSYHSGR